MTAESPEIFNWFNSLGLSKKVPVVASAAKQSPNSVLKSGDCFVVTLLAKTFLDFLDSPNAAQRLASRAWVLQDLARTSARNYAGMACIDADHAVWVTQVWRKAPGLHCHTKHDSETENRDA